MPTANTCDSPKHPIGARLLHRVSDALSVLATAREAQRDCEVLMSLSDADLAARGLDRRAVRDVVAARFRSL